MRRLGNAVLPASQRREPDELRERLDLSMGDRPAKRSAFWSMLLLSGAIAVAGVLADSTATVIGAMIIAPLSVPIMGIALGIVEGSTALVRRSLLLVVLGLGAVVLIGVLASLALPGTTDLLANSQISGRTSPKLVDLLAAVATGLAGAVALSRRDVADVLPGVAIAISLVPPLGVVGVCLGQGAGFLALGAFLLFLSNVVALVLAGTLVFAASGYAVQPPPARGQAAASARRRQVPAYVWLMLAAVALPLGANTAANYLVSLWTARATDAADEWVAQAPGGRVESVTVQSRTLFVRVQVPGTLPEVDTLLERLEGQVPDGVRVVVDATRGERVAVGVVGE